MGKKKSNVLSLEQKRPAQLDDIQAARLIAEACAKDEPSKEAQEYYLQLLGSDPQEWRHHGELAAEALDLAFKNFWMGYVTKASVKHGAQLLKAELGYDDASPIERLLIEQAVLCHVRLGMVEHLYSRQLAGSYRLEIGAHWEMRLTLAQRRYMKAISTLARVRVMLARLPKSVQSIQGQTLAKTA